MQQAAPGKSRSRLVPVGFVLMVVGMTFPRALSTVAKNMEPGPVRSGIVALMILLLVGFLVGLVAAVVGILRNRRMGAG